MCKIKKYDNLILIIILSLISLYFIKSNYSFRYAVGYSMYPTIHSNDIYIVKIVNKANKNELKNNDIIIFKKEWFSNKPMIKRIIGKEGDIIEQKFDNIYVNGERKRSGVILEVTKDTKVELKSGEYFVLGDNILDSVDSRIYGIVNESEITHKYVFNLSRFISKIFSNHYKKALCY